MIYYEQKRLFITFTNDAAQLVDPSKVTLRVTYPDKSSVVFEYPATLGRASIGLFYWDPALTAAGGYKLLSKGTDVNGRTIYNEISLIVTKSMFTAAEM